MSVLACTLSATVYAAPAKRVILISWDGAANWVVDRLLAEGRLPNVARLARVGVRADFCTPAAPSKTASGHAALWTGAFGDVNGITANDVPILPRAEHTLLEHNSGFSPDSLRAEPLWVTAATAGKQVVVLSAPQAFPPDRWFASLRAARVPNDRLVCFSGFGAGIGTDKVWDGTNLRPAEGWAPLPPHHGAPREFSFSVGDATFYALVYDDPTDPVEGADTLLIRQGSKQRARAVAAVTLKPAEAADNVRHFSPRFRVTQGNRIGYTYFRLFALAPNGQMAFYQRGGTGMQGGVARQEVRRYLDAYGGFHTAPDESYRNGALGKTLWQGGDGTAERRLLECIRLDDEFLKRGTRYALKRWKPDLLIHYTPWCDGAGHLWVGALDPDGPRYDPVLARKLWPYYRAVYQLQDEWLGDILDHADKGTVTCLVSDHGMAGVGKTFSVNFVLEKAGLLTRTADNRIDLARTRICAPTWRSYYLNVNGTDWKGGIVPPAEREATLRAAEEALLGTVDPATGRHIVTGVFRPDTALGLGLGGPAGGDLYFDVAPGYEPTSDLIQTMVETWPSPIGGGEHGFWPLHAKMQAICFMGGPGVRHGVRLSGIRQIDVAPTLSRLLGISAPRDARGHVLGEALITSGRKQDQGQPAPGGPTATNRPFGRRLPVGGR